MLDSTSHRVVVQLCKGCCGQVVKASGWQSFDCQFKPCLSTIMAAPLCCGLGYRFRTDGRIHQSLFYLQVRSRGQYVLPMCEQTDLIFAVSALLSNDTESLDWTDQEKVSTVFVHWPLHHSWQWHKVQNSKLKKLPANERKCKTVKTHQQTEGLKPKCVIFLLYLELTVDMTKQQISPPCIL